MPLHVSSTMCSSSGGQNCIIQPLVSSHSVGGRPVPNLLWNDMREWYLHVKIKKLVWGGGLVVAHFKVVPRYWPRGTVEYHGRQSG